MLNFAVQIPTFKAHFFAQANSTEILQSKWGNNKNNRSLKWQEECALFQGCFGSIKNKITHKKWEILAAELSIYLVPSWSEWTIMYFHFPTRPTGIFLETSCQLHIFNTKNFYFTKRRLSVPESNKHAVNAVILLLPFQFELSLHHYKHNNYYKPIRLLEIQYSVDFWQFDWLIAYCLHFYSDDQDSVYLMLLIMETDKNPTSSSFKTV